jgi:hypothetical protein
MEAQLAEASTFPAQAYANSFFAEFPTDARFLQCTFQKISPTSNIEGKTIEFNLDRYDAANVYQIQETYVEVSVGIYKGNNELPAVDKNVGTVNNLLHSLFESVRIIVNDVPISVSPGNYPYKAYIANCLTYPQAVKTCQLICQGWISDTAPHMGPTISNSGWEARSLMFRKNYDQSKPYRSEGVTLFGRLMHDLVTCETGLPPNTKVKIELDRSTDEFVVMCPKDDVNEKYKIKILNIALYVPVAQLSASVFNEISTILTRKILPKVITIHYRRIEVRPVTVPRGKIDFYTDSIFNDADLPCRIVICFVDATAKIGSYETNPFDFQRSWEVEVDDVTRNNPNTPSEREIFLEKKLLSLEKDFKEFRAFVTNINEKKTSKGKGRGKKSKPVEVQPQPCTSFEAQVEEEALRRLREFIGHRNLDLDVESGSSRSVRSAQQTRPIPEDLMTDDNSSVVTLPEKTKKTIFISNIQLCLNQNKIDQIEDKQTEDECMQAYWRMSAFNGQMNNQHTAGISYDDFRQ